MKAGELWANLADGALYLGTATTAIVIGQAAVTAQKLATARTIGMTGDGSFSVSFDGSANVSGALTLANTGVTAGTYNTVTVNAKGLITSAVNTAYLTGLTASGDATGTSSGAGIALTLASTGVAAGTYNTVSVDLKGRVVSGSNVAYLQGNQTITVSGDATGSGTTAIALTLASVGTAGTYTKVTTDGKGRVISGTALSSSDVTTALGYTPLNSALGAVIFQSTWNASTNVPPLVSSTGTKGYYYRVSVAGSTNLDGVTQWNPGDSAIFDGNVWTKIDGLASEVSSVNGQVGAVTITTITGNAGTASKLAAAVTIAHSGDATGSASFDGSAGITIPMTLANSGVTAGTYDGVVVDSKGRVTAGVASTISGDATGTAAGANTVLTLATVMTAGTYVGQVIDAKGRTTSYVPPTTLSGYGITDAFGTGTSVTVDLGTF